MARCKECYHYEICAKQCRMVQIDEHTWDNYEELDDVEKFCEHYKHTADVVPKSEPERLVDRWIGSGELTPDEKTLRLIEALCDEAKRYERYYFNHEYDKLIGEAKAEVAKEIFEEIENLMDKKFIITHGVVLVSKENFAELKKKFEEKYGGSQ